MNKRSIFGCLGALVLTVATVFTPSYVSAAPEDIINTATLGSMTIHKYDSTAARANGVDLDQFDPDGKEHKDIETALQNYVIKDVEFTYAKVANINTVTENGKIEIRYDIPTGKGSLAEILGLADKANYNSTEINNALKAKLLANSTAIRSELEKYVKNIAVNAPRGSVDTDANGEAIVTNLPVGLYLVVETKVPANVQETVDPFFVSVPMTDVEGNEWFYNIELYPKNQTDIPDLDKLVRQHDDYQHYNKKEYMDTATGSSGDVMDYIFVSRVPNIDSAATYFEKWVFEDRMDKGLNYNEADGVTIRFYNTEAEARANDSVPRLIWDKTMEGDNVNSRFKVTYTGTNADYRSMTVLLKAKGLEELNTALDNTYMVVSYSATINSDNTVVMGDKGNNNNVTLTWKRTHTPEDLLRDRARVYTFGIDLTKKFTTSDSVPHPDPTKVQFVLQNKTDGHYIRATSNTGGVYYVKDVADKTSVRAEDSPEVTTFTPDRNGKLLINGLEANEYVLTEIRTQDGYSLLKEPIRINIMCTEDSIIPTKTTLYDINAKRNNRNTQVIDTRIKDASATVDDSDTKMMKQDSSNSNNALVEMTVTNTPSFGLPMTGGTGTIMFTIGGCALALCGIFLITRKSKGVDEE